MARITDGNIGLFDVATLVCLGSISKSVCVVMVWLGSGKKKTPTCLASCWGIVYWLKRRALVDTNAVADGPTCRDTYQVFGLVSDLNKHGVDTISNFTFDRNLNIDIFLWNQKIQINRREYLYIINVQVSTHLPANCSSSSLFYSSHYQQMVCVGSAPASLPQRPILTGIAALPPRPQSQPQHNITDSGGEYDTVIKTLIDFQMHKSSQETYNPAASAFCFIFLPLLCRVDVENHQKGRQSCHRRFSGGLDRTDGSPLL